MESPLLVRSIPARTSSPSARGKNSRILQGLAAKACSPGLQAPAPGLPPPGAWLLPLCLALRGIRANPGAGGVGEEKGSEASKSLSFKIEVNQAIWRSQRPKTLLGPVACEDPT